MEVVVALGIIVIVVVVISIHVYWLQHRVRILEDQIVRISEVLNQASPELANRIQEGGTWVATGERWYDDDVIEAEE